MIYTELFHLNPIKLNFTFTAIKGDDEESKQNKCVKSNFRFIVSIFDDFNFGCGRTLVLILRCKLQE